MLLKSIDNNNQDISASDSEWLAFCDAAKKSFGSEIYDRWLSKLDLHLLSEQEVIMSVPSKFLRDWIRREYLENEEAGSDGNLEQIWLKTKPNLKKVSVIYIESKIESKSLSDKNIINHQAQGNVISISKHDNVFSFGVELNPRFTFDNFVVGSCNKLAAGVAKVIAKVSNYTLLDQDVSPLFLYGGVGLGKTHLAQAVAWHIKENEKQTRVLYISAERFMNQFVKALRGKDIMSFKEQFRSIDVLIIDDLQFICGKDGTQEELLNTLNSLIENNKKIIIVCDRSPGDLADISTKLKSKVASGVIADFKSPDYATRLEILKVKAKNLDIEIDEEVLQLLANKINSSVRDLEGALKKIAANYIFTGEEINIRNTKELLKDLFRTNHSEATIEKIQKIVADYFEIKISDLKSSSRARTVARPRQIAMYLCKKLTVKNLPEIGREFGGKNHATVIHAIKKIEDLIDVDSQIASQIKELEGKISL